MIYFSTAEFNTSDSIIPDDVKGKILNNFISPLHDIREEFNKELHIRSGWRPPQYNKSIGGASNSEHLFKIDKAGACDISPTISGITPTNEDMDLLETLLINSGKFRRIARYKTFFHIDYKDPGHSCDRALFDATSNKWIFVMCF